MSEHDFDTAVQVTSVSVSPLTSYLRTAGFAAIGDGGRALYMRVSAEPAHPGKIQSADGAWWELARQSVNPFMFGAKGDGSTDDAEALQAFFDYISQVDCGCAKMDGVFLTSAALAIGPPDGTSATRRFTGRMKITATTAIEKIVTFQGLLQAVWDGILEVNGTGGPTPSTRTCTHCVFTGNSTGRFRIGGIIVRYARGIGLYIQSDLTLANQNISSFGHVFAQSCGASYATGGALPTGTSTDFSARSDTGSSGSVGQRSMLTVDDLPDEWIDETVGTQQHFIVYDGAVYYITAVDRPAGTISVFPWLPLEVTSGTIYYATGAGVYVMGGNAGQLFFQAVDVSNSAIGLGSAALYGSDFGSAQVQANVVGIALGAGPLNSNAAAAFTKPYFESNIVDVLRVTRAVPSQFYASFISPTLIDVSKMKALPSRLTSGALSTSDNSFEGILGLNLFNGDGYEKRIDNAFGAGSAFTFRLDKADKSMHVRRISSASFTVTLAYDSGLHAIYGYDSGKVTISGPGASNQPTGAIVFDPPAGHSINGGAADATLTFTGFHGPAVFEVFRQGIDWKISLVLGREHPESITTIATDAGATLTPWSTSPTVIHSGTLTADRTITLSTANAVAGKTRFMITRTGGSAFNLNVGAGPLKTLATNTWGEFVYNGSTYYLAAYGAL